MNAVVPVGASAPASIPVPHALHECVAYAVRRYLADIESRPDANLYALVMSEVELPLLRETVAWYGGNQSKAAAALGINRATLRKKLRQYRLAD